jgi:hypothetical protein
LTAFWKVIEQVKHLFPECAIQVGFPPQLVHRTGLPLDECAQLVINYCILAGSLDAVRRAGQMRRSQTWRPAESTHQAGWRAMGNYGDDSVVACGGGVC